MRDTLIIALLKKMCFFDDVKPFFDDQVEEECSNLHQTDLATLSIIHDEYQTKLVQHDAMQEDELVHDLLQQDDEYQTKLVHHAMFTKNSIGAPERKIRD